MWFDNWNDILRTLFVGGAAYGTLIIVLRVTGKRTLSQLNAFDFIVTVALGSTLATILLSTDVSWAEGVAALGLLTGLQFVVAWVTSRREKVRAVLTSSPVVLLSAGRMRPEALRRNRLSESEVLQAIRNNGVGDISQIAVVVLETNGTFSVIRSEQLGDSSALDGVVR